MLMGGDGEDLSTAMTIGDLFFSSKFLLQRVLEDYKMTTFSPCMVF